ncbi:N-acylneuraminate cytidylyltransferase [Jannaschia faecimaris]|uniref:N-acylneuraminate cytidylyltransferase n=1 Tax=Jannaschia faecimaris TaxID=1244108 RepID=A0A1H3JR30_9RHOB|nr:pseudaminic acid cytidylyltransferase [Jannaschia faecimaris]SDY42341.1 N-acylneuraminate cytidylyltransferase [Jannaschia faecimaris]
MRDPSEGPVLILPARGGSKRIPRKNVRPFAGRPAIGWPIAAAQDSNLFDRIVVTTDDAEIAKVARACGAEVPFLRADDLSDDHAGTTEVIRDAVTRLGLPVTTPVCCLYPTAFFVTGDDLKAGFAALGRGATWALSLGKYRTPIQRAYRQDGTRVAAFDAAQMPKRSQDLEEAFFDAGQFYWARAATWTDPEARIWDGAAAVVLPDDRCIDVDTPDDWARAERLAGLMGLGD